MELFGNLLDNACKWTHTQVEVKVYKSEKFFNLEVADNGPGFNEKDIPKLTQRGVRADERMEGSGIGLHVVQEIVSLHQGVLELGHAPKNGAKVVVKIPIS